MKAKKMSSSFEEEKNVSVVRTEAGAYGALSPLVCCGARESSTFSYSSYSINSFHSTKQSTNSLLCTIDDLSPFTYIFLTPFEIGSGNHVARRGYAHG